MNSTTWLRQTPGMPFYRRDTSSSPPGHVRSRLDAPGAFVPHPKDTGASAHKLNEKSAKLPPWVMKKITSKILRKFSAQINFRVWGKLATRDVPTANHYFFVEIKRIKRQVLVNCKKTISRPLKTLSRGSTAIVSLAASRLMAADQRDSIARPNRERRRLFVWRLIV